MRPRFSTSRAFSIIYAMLVLGAAPGCAPVEPSMAATAAFDSYISAVEARLAQQHRSPNTVVAPVDVDRLRRGELIIERLTPSKEANLPGAMLHHWRGTAFAPGATAVDFEKLLRDVSAYPAYYQPQVVKASVLSGQGDHYETQMRVRQKHVITVVLDMVSDVRHTQLDAQRGYSIARSTRIEEIDSPGTAREREMSGSEEHGFLWRLNTYWSYEERDGGVYMQIETVSLTRSIPTGLGWVVRPFVESVPRESLEFTLQSTGKALQKGAERGEK